MEDTPCFTGWRIVRRIGRGHFGTVYEIENESDSAFGTPAVHSAMKIIPVPPEEDWDALRAEYSDAEVTTLLRRQINNISEEFQMMSQLQGHSNIVSYHSHAIIQRENRQGWNVLISMELLTPLPSYFKEKAMQEEEAIRLGKNMCNALKRCEECVILHRDIKPQNIFVNKYGDFKLGDFGVARATEHMTATSVAGTYDYMAPEVVSKGKYDKRVDIYSLGLVLYWLLNERRGPFLPLPPEVADIASQNAAAWKRIGGADIPRPAHGSRELQDIVLKACAFKPEDRYQSAAEFYDALKRLAEGNGEVIEPGGHEEPISDVKELQGTEVPQETDPLSTLPASGDAKGGHQASEEDHNETVSAFGNKTKPDKDDTNQKNAGGQEQKKRNKLLPLVIAAAWAAVLLVGVIGHFNCWFGHSWDDGVVTEAPTHTADGTKTYTCSVCGQTREETVAQLTEHTYDQEVVDLQYLKSEATCTDSAVYYYSCICGETGTETFTYGEANGHTWDAGVVTVEATYTTTGIKTYTCSACGQTKEETVAQLSTDGVRISSDFDVFWSLSADGVLTLSGSGITPNYVYRDTARPWALESVSAVIVENGITAIGSGLFEGAYNIKTVILPDSVTAIGERAFMECSSLSEITMPTKLASLGQYAFSGCTSLTSISIPQGIDNIAIRTFYYTGLQSIVIPEGVRTIEKEAFSASFALCSVSFPNSLNEIGLLAFSECSSLTAVQLPENCVTCNSFDEQVQITYFSDKSAALATASVTVVASGTCGDNLTWVLDDAGTLTISGSGEMDNHDYYGAPWYSWKDTIKKVIVEDGVTAIGDGAFAWCGSLTSISIPNSVTFIGDYAFRDCSALVSITIPNRVTFIGDYAFCCCSALTSMTIPDSVTSIGDSAFSNCSALASINIPDNITSIEHGTFDSCWSLTSIIIPDNVTFIGDYAFYDCRELTSITIPEGVTSIGDWVFTYCSSLTSFTIPDNVTSVGNRAFHGCTGLTSITIPNSVTSIKYAAFSYCSSLKNVYYAGSKSERNRITIDNDENGNDALLTATWYYSN